ncbi:tRNA (guanosine(37)-N1)-methyltransferase TrmD [Patescibacteria group bacterium]|nr:MAG: tRNA (guanosine(37)-N1)-methyltransferase TrmD [Patescibacteria group bacterium]
MNFHIITLFPESFSSYLGESILKRAIEDKKIAVKFYNPRDFAVQPKNRPQTYSERRVDDKPYGGGPGMVIEALPVVKAIESAIKTSKLKTKNYKLSTKILWFTPDGKQFDTATAKKFSDTVKNIILVCGRYEGIDARVKKVFKMEEVSVGPFVLTGGELPAMLVIDCIARQVEGVLGDFASREEARVSSPDTYTRPETIVYKNKKYKVPKVLLSGDHKKIDEWRMEMRNKKTR